MAQKWYADPGQWSQQLVVGGLAYTAGAVVFQPFVGGKPSGKFEVFADGFAGPAPVKIQSEYAARPDGVAVAPDGSLYITDSQKGKIWRVFYRG